MGLISRKSSKNRRRWFDDWLRWIKKIKAQKHHRNYESAKDTVIDGDEQELDYVPDSSHDSKTNSTRGCDFFEFIDIWLFAGS